MTRTLRNGLAALTAASMIACSRQHLQARFADEATDSVRISYSQGMADFIPLTSGAGPEASYIYSPSRNTWYEVGMINPSFPQGDQLHQRWTTMLSAIGADTNAIQVHSHRDVRAQKDKLINDAYQAQLQFNRNRLLTIEEKTALKARISNLFNAMLSLPTDGDLSSAAVTNARLAHTAAKRLKTAVVSSYGTVFYDVVWPDTTQAGTEALETEVLHKIFKIGSDLVTNNMDATESPQRLIALYSRMLTSPHYKLTFVPH